MSTPELLSIQKLDVYAAAKEFARRVHVARVQDPELRDQARRASKSTFLQVCEGLPYRKAPTGRRYFTAASASVGEALGAIDLANTLGLVEQGEAETIQALGVRLTKMLHGLMR
jgi:four helix bundle protein